MQHTIKSELSDKIAKIEVQSEGDVYWECGSIGIFDEYSNEIDIDFDYSDINQPFEDLDEMLERVAEYFGVDRDLVEYC